MLSSNHSKFDAIIFDLDGTLIDSVNDIAGSVNHVRSQMNLNSLPIEEIRNYIGDGIRLLMERALKTQEPSIIDHAIAQWKPHYITHCLDQTKFYPGIDRLLLSLKKIPLAVVTNKPEIATHRILEGLKVRKLFSSVVGGDTTPYRKPHPEPLKFAVAKMFSKKSKKSRILVIGDSPNDILAARNAGYISCGIGWGIGAPAIIHNAKPDHFIQSPEEILKIVFGV